MKHQAAEMPPVGLPPAAFRRLCVETIFYNLRCLACRPAAFRRLCVETKIEVELSSDGKPAAFRRLCVETVKMA